MEYTNISFAYNRYQNNLSMIAVENTAENIQPHPFCLFQYITVNNNTKQKTC